MKFFIIFIFTVLLSISVSNHNVLGSQHKIRSKRLTNAQSDTTNLFKHEVRITTEGGFCSGTIIADNFVLTAAHCVIVKGTGNVININRQLMEVTVGITMVNNDSEYQTVRIVETIYLPNFFFNSLDTDDNLRNMIGDIAVLKLNYKLGLGIDPRIEALNLPMQAYQNNDNPPNNHIMFTGFGGTRVVYNPKIRDHVIGEFPVYLQYSNAVILPSNSCPLVGNPQLKMCAKLANPGAGTCGGDSGGALINYEQKTVLGVLSFGPKMCNQASPTVYTRVFPYLRFIINSMNDVSDEMTRRESFAANPAYQNALRNNKYTYHWIYIPSLMTDKTPNRPGFNNFRRW